MKYTVITKQGKVMCFYIEDTARMYAQLYAGTVITEAVLDTVEETV